MGQSNLLFRLSLPKKCQVIECMKGKFKKKLVSITQTLHFQTLQHNSWSLMKDKNFRIEMFIAMMKNKAVISPLSQHANQQTVQLKKDRPLPLWGIMPPSLTPHSWLILPLFSGPSCFVFLGYGAWWGGGGRSHTNLTWRGGRVRVRVSPQPSWQGGFWPIFPEK